MVEARTYRYQGPAIYTPERPAPIETEAVQKAIFDTVQMFTGFDLDTLKSENQAAQPSEARHLAIALFLMLTPLTQEQIGAIFNRDHATVYHSKRTVLGRLDVDRHFVERFHAIYRHCVNYSH